MNEDKNSKTMIRRSWYDVQIPTYGGHDLYFNDEEREERVRYLNDMENDGVITWNQKLGYLPIKKTKVESVTRKSAKSVKNPHAAKIKKYFKEHVDVGRRAMRTAKLWNKAVSLVRREIRGKRSKQAQPLLDALEQLIARNPPITFAQKQRPPDPSSLPPPRIQVIREKGPQSKPQRKRITPVLITSPEPQPKPQRKRITPEVSDDAGVAALAELNAKRKKYANALAEFKKGKGPAPEGDHASWRYFMDWLDQAIPKAPPDIPNFEELSKQIEKRRQARK